MRNGLEYFVREKCRLEHALQKTAVLKQIVVKKIVSVCVCALARVPFITKLSSDVKNQ